MTCELQCYVVLSARCQYCDTLFFYVREEIYSNYAENIMDKDRLGAFSKDPLLKELENFLV
jgi:hypothetical protein